MDTTSISALEQGAEPRLQPAAALLRVVHETSYTYASPVELAHHMAFLRPLEDATQRVEAFEMHVEPAPSEHASTRDAFGNSRAFFSLTTPHSALSVQARSLVRVAPRYAGLLPAASLPWEQGRDSLRFLAGARFEPAAEFAFPSPMVPLHRELRAYALASFAPGRPLAEAAIELMRRVHDDFRYEPQSTHVSTPLLQAFKQRRGVCQDFAHLMIGCLRSLGLAARYVSGYLLTEPPPGQPRLLGADASHAWVSVHAPGAQAGENWLDLDPTNNCVPGPEHVRLAIGRDYGDVTPLGGVIRGGGHHTLVVRVSTEAVRQWV